MHLLAAIQSGPLQQSQSLINHLSLLLSLFYFIFGFDNAPAMIVLLGLKLLRCSVKNKFPPGRRN